MNLGSGKNSWIFREHLTDISNKELVIFIAEAKSRKAPAEESKILARDSKKLFKILEKNGKRSIRYDAGEIAVQMNEVEISAKEFEEIQNLDSSQKLYDYMIKNFSALEYESTFVD